MDEKKKVALNEEQLDEVSGGEKDELMVYYRRHKRCAADPTHVYQEIFDACPYCGSKEFIYV